MIDFIVAFGGGSPMDVAKAVGVVAKYGGSVTDYEGAHKVPGPIVPLIAIPTTAGTGSEVTAFSVITDHSRNYKLTVFSYEILPKYAILDAELITTAPASVVAACGIDAFIHAEETYVSTAASPFSDALAEKAMALIGKNIRRFVANRNDIEAAEAMMTGSLFAGIAFSFARLGNVHAMSHPVSAFFDVPHGVANAVLLPVIAEYNALADHGKYLTIYNDISPIPAYADEFEPMMLVDAIRELCTDIGIPENLTIAINNASKTGTVTKEEIESRIEPMAVDAMKSGNIAVNPRASRQCDIEMLYRRALQVNINGCKQLFDYAACPYPEGMNGDRLMYFQHTDISRVVFEGYVDDDEIMMCDNIVNAMEKTEIERADVRKLKRSMVN